jgi:hypothetical protein
MLNSLLRHSTRRRDGGKQLINAIAC